MRCFTKFSGHGIISAEEKNAAVKQTYSFLAPLTNETVLRSRAVERDSAGS